MDHLLANVDKPIPSAEDEDEDEALQLHIKKTGASDEPVANVR